MPAVARWILWASLALAPITALVDLVAHPGKVVLFTLSALSLIPLAWLIGIATEQAAEHTGPGIGGFLNASFGNAPELIIALFAVNDDLPQVVRGSLSGSVISNLLLVLGVTQLAGPAKELDRRSLLTQLGLVAAATLAFLPAVVLGYTGHPERHAVVRTSIPIAVVLLVLYLAITRGNLQRHHEQERAAPAAGSWTLPVALGTLAAATAATAVMSELLVHSLDAFAKAVGASEFFIAVVIVAIVGNAAEHGGSVLIARGGKMKLATEIAVSSGAQVALLVAPAVMLLSLAFSHPLGFAFRWEELTAMGGAAALVTGAVWNGRSSHRKGAVLVLAYAGVVAGFLAAGNR
jgi:Ca2+:H+ antiporter